MSSISFAQSQTHSKAEISHRVTSALAIAFFGYDSSDSTIVKRAAAFKKNGASVVGFMFYRERGMPQRSLSWENVHLGVTADRNYLRRFPKLFGGLRRIIRQRALLHQCDVIYARNLDMLLLAVLAKRLTGSRIPIVYECLDIRPVFFGRGKASKLFRCAERRLLSASELLVVSAPDYIDRYFEPVQHYRGPSFLLENKLPGDTISLRPSSQKSDLPPGPPWVIGIFGVQRCKRSLSILKHVAEQLGDRVRIYIRGILSETDLSKEFIEELCRTQKNIIFEGAYSNPKDLPEIYGKVHFIWASDFGDADGNSKLCLVNRIYEGGLFGAVMLAGGNSATGRMVERERLGFTLEEPLEDTLPAFLKNLDNAKYCEAKRLVNEASPALFIDEADTAKLVGELKRLARSS